MKPRPAAVLFDLFETLVDFERERLPLVTVAGKAIRTTSAAAHAAVREVAVVGVEDPEHVAEARASALDFIKGHRVEELQALGEEIFEEAPSDSRPANDGQTVAMDDTHTAPIGEIAAAADAYGWEVDLGGLATIWRGGCIIRARFLDRIREAYQGDPGLRSLLLADYFRDAVAGAQDVSVAIERGKRS